MSTKYILYAIYPESKEIVIEANSMLAVRQAAKQYKDKYKWEYTFLLYKRDRHTGRRIVVDGWKV